MARTWPWYAPEIDSQWAFDFEDARRTDYYSLAMVCVFILLHGDLDNSLQCGTGSAWSMPACVEYLRRQGAFQSRITELLQSLNGIELEQRRQLQDFFSCALSEDPETRTLSLQGLFFEHAQRTDIGVVLFEEITPVFYAQGPAWATQFKVSVTSRNIHLLTVARLPRSTIGL